LTVRSPQGYFRTVQPREASPRLAKKVIRVPDSGVALMPVVLDAASQWVVFTCEERRFAVPLERVRGIATPQPFTRLPGCGPEVAGLIGLRGRVLTVFDFGVVLAARPAALLPDHRVLLVEDGDRLIGCVVDDVNAVAEVVIHPPAREEERLAGVDPEGAHVLGTGEHEGEPFVAVDLDMVLGRLLA
jgi:purine-binding chemotaxis protein CheW